MRQLGRFLAEPATWNERVALATCGFICSWVPTVGVILAVMR